MSTQALADYGCPHSEEFFNLRAKLLFEKARQCSITQEPCWNWNKMDAVTTCDVKKKAAKEAEAKGDKP